MNLYRKVRPTSFDDVIGNEAELKAFQSKLKKKDTQVFVISGASGTGKTTIARIAGTMLGADAYSITEINSANNRGIDTARDLQEDLKYSVSEENPKIIIVDECFHGNSLVETPLGKRKIENIYKGDTIYNVDGKTTVTKVFKNKVPLDRVVKLKLSNKKLIYCSKEHEFLTNNGWKPAIELNKKDLIIPYSYSIMNDIQSQRSSLNEKMPNMPSGIIKKIKQKILFQKMLWGEFTKNSKGRMQVLWKEYIRPFKGQIYSTILQSELCFETSSANASYSKNDTLNGICGKNKKGTEHFSKGKSKESEGNSKSLFRENVKKQPKQESGGNRKSKINEKDKRNFECMARETRGQRSIFGTTNDTSGLVRMGYGSCNFNPSKKRRWFSILLQGRYRKSKIKNSNRSRWERTSAEIKYGERFQKRKEVRGVRLESLEVYKQGNNEKSFRGIITNKDKIKGFITFYDLEVAGNHNYFVNGCTVHNCHGTTKDWKRAMLKPLEDTPKNVYFFLCTTDPKQLYKGDEGKAIKTRCTEIKMGNLNSDDLYRLLRRTAKSEKLEIPKTVLKEIAENSEGSPRQALTLLEKIMDLKEESDMLASIKMPEEEEKLSIDLCRKLLTAKKWNDVSPILKGLKEVDEESIRYAVLGYANAVLLNSGNPRCAVIIECFSEPFYNSKKAGLSLACYQVIFGE